MRDSIDCTFVIANIYQYIDCELPLNDHKLIVDHLTTCVACQDKVHFQSSFKLMVKEKSQYAMPQGLRDSVLQTLFVNSNQEGTISVSSEEILSTHLKIRSFDRPNFSRTDSDDTIEDNE